jgi:hypothetical protein
LLRFSGVLFVLIGGLAIQETADNTIVPISNAFWAVQLSLIAFSISLAASLYVTWPFWISLKDLRDLPENNDVKSTVLRWDGLRLIRSRTIAIRVSYLTAVLGTVAVTRQLGLFSGGDGEKPKKPVVSTTANNHSPYHLPA